MHLDLIQTLSLAGKTAVPNDDRIGCAGRHAWVIDGATDLGEPGLMGERGGAAWLADAAHRAFMDASGALAAVCEQVFAVVAADYRRDRQREPIAPWELPRASFAAVALEGDRLACGFLGDCTVIHRSARGVAFLTPEPDRQQEQAEAAALGPGIGADSVRSPHVLADRRAARVRPKAVLSVDAEQARAVMNYAQAPLARGDDLLLMSDGFATLIDTYRHYDAPTLMARVLESGLLPLAEELRRIEREDAACLRYPRFKASDDASVIWLRVGG
ncbi:protein phosphatase 2C domain-containing protein [Metapseudomonas furukawaii]|uniref:Protein phosphatase 2C-like protein n=1 Tax=Metapseudomonas furukawaii TaxID=1149133 RepID=A0AAD1C1S3_METFU|nr:protein phosphatase 2C domain-containing protein [Pseudomonas furukawaii]ELS25481.1 Hypothetical protein ppKF707_5647 [Pseudomonas furukawaii]BAU74004.1 hypothetical protein KF707C_23160 [Pseudomonas furukawaii]